MKYFIDTEFIEQQKNPWFGSSYHFLQLISIGIVSEDGREYYAINSGFSKRRASTWVKENVIAKLEYPLSHQDFRRIGMWKTMNEIKYDVLKFFGAELRHCGGKDIRFEYHVPVVPEIYAYFADYDYVVFCSIFGGMMHLPVGMPMYCLDLKQIMHQAGLSQEWKRERCPDPEGEHNALVDARWNHKLYKTMRPLIPSI